MKESGVGRSSDNSNRSGQSRGQGVLMAEKLRLAVVGLVHDHVWGELRRWLDTNRIEIVAAADANIPLRERIRQEFGVDQRFDSADAMFEACQIDIVQVCTSNAAAADVVEQAARRGIHVMLEKPMAATLEQADRMLTAANKSDIQFMINWPFRWRPNTLQSWKLVSDGIVGDVFNARVRMAHKGPREFGCSEYFCNWLYDPSQNGGGAIIDYCCYGAAAFRHVFGMPNSVQAVAARLAKKDIAVDDNAAITLIYDDRFAVTEASWCQIPSYHDSVYMGTKGTLWTEDGKIMVAIENSQQEITVEPLPNGRRTGPEYFLTCLENGETPADVCAPRVCRDTQEILEAGLRSAESGTRISLPIGSDK